MNFKREVEERAMKFEGYRRFPYRDSTGHLTVGYGRNLTDNPYTAEELEVLYDSIKTGMNNGVAAADGSCNVSAAGENATDEVAAMLDEFHKRLLRKDLEKANRDASRLGVYVKVPERVKAVLTDLVYNMGLNSVKGFSGMIDHLNKANYDMAAVELLNSSYALETKTRAVANAEKMCNDMEAVKASLARLYPSKYTQLNEYMD